MRKILYTYLAVLARLLLKRYKPLIIAVTGSVGKTTTKDMIAAALSSSYRVRASACSYNNEVGMPLTIIGVPSGHRSIFGWLGVIVNATSLIFFYQKRYPQVLILEMGADHPGDLAYLTSLAKPDISVLAAISSAHLEFFKSLEEVAMEKRTILENLKPKGIAVLNEDDAMVLASKVRKDVTVFRYGLSDKADVTATEPRPYFNGIEEKHIDGGITFKLNYKGSSVPVHFEGILGKPAIASALAATSVGLSLGMNLVDISHAFEKYRGTPGRLRLLAGVKGTTIIDDSYNASPIAMVAAVTALAETPKEKKQWRWAILGDMAELGSETERGHEAVGKELAKQQIDGLVTVGERARMIAQAARGAGLDARNIFSFSKAEEAGKFLQERLETGDVVLIKGSQIMRMEKIVKEIMADPKNAKTLLVRQGSEWQTL
ncbi:hypothetical protein COV04_04695 [Candidatus Uhrbacteria bacterium CG10_big_fil_rev_8_21_14_0_10_48_11]|uniref:UDP-N-acetylmuramoyl-tripeptide--D-alanyl-D-alanine ligase n=1 Tax=Candidatus Uhrbacteria bacterium CG10_big_fil_rev_8_21_14_0_10_48_11 TaxID=1975037 RepID=A0A2M8LDF9_9BACT|nr:MAG: hypothetical protein COV04_04695 [Candidatus Uhrbacteria bacterium CG10_big_fil_rev_8_21_14_0_10_48_11]